MDCEDEKIDSIVEKLKAEQSFVEHLTLSQAEALKIGDLVDHRDTVGRYILATIQKKQGSMLQMNYIGWSSKWDCWSDYNVELYKFAAPRSISRRRNTRFPWAQDGDFVRFRPFRRKEHGNEWKFGKIRRFDSNSGQAQIVYTQNLNSLQDSKGNIGDPDLQAATVNSNKQWLFWVHLDNPKEVSGWFSSNGASEAVQFKQRQNMSEVYQREEFDDTEFIVGQHGQRFGAIRALMASISTPLHSMLYGPFREANHHESVSLPLVTPKAFVGMKLYAYSLPIDLDALGLYDTCRAADMFDIKGLHIFCKSNLPRAIEKDLSSACLLLDKVIDFTNDKIIRDMCLDTLSRLSLVKLFGLPEFYQMRRECIYALMQHLLNYKNKKNDDTHHLHPQQRSSHHKKVYNEFVNAQEHSWLLCCVWSRQKKIEPPADVAFDKSSRKEGRWLCDMGYLAENDTRNIEQMRHFYQRIRPLLEEIEFSAMSAEFFTQAVRCWNILTFEQIVWVQDKMLLNDTSSSAMPPFNETLFSSIPKTPTKASLSAITAATTEMRIEEQKTDQDSQERHNISFTSTRKQEQQNDIKVKKRSSSLPSSNNKDCNWKEKYPNLKKKNPKRKFSQMQDITTISTSTSISSTNSNANININPTTTTTTATTTTGTTAATTTTGIPTSNVSPANTHIPISRLLFNELIGSDTMSPIEIDDKDWNSQTSDNEISNNECTFPPKKRKKQSQYIDDQ